MYSKYTALALAVLAASATATPFPQGAPSISTSLATPAGSQAAAATGTGAAAPSGRAPTLPPGVAAWYGQTSGGDLNTICADKSYGAIVLAFVDEYFSGGGWPALSLAPFAPPSAAQTKAGATNLTDGSSLVPAIKSCQSSGKKVFMSIGGEFGLTNFTSEDQGSEFASTMWDLFLGGNNATAAPLRPFGDVTLDGIDIDNETHDRTGYLGFVKTLREKFATDTSRDYYIAAAPQCPRNGGTGDASLSDEVLQQTDITWVQFYNNEAAKCNHGQSGFLQSVQDWAKAISPSQLWIAAPGGPTVQSASNGFADLATMQKEVGQIANLGIDNINGGWALWDSVTAGNNSNYQQDVASAIQSAYGGASTGAPTSTVKLPKTTTTKRVTTPVGTPKTTPTHRATTPTTPRTTPTRAAVPRFI